MTFDGANKIIILSSSSISASEIWSEWVRWLETPINNIWLPALKQVGGDDLGGGLLIPPYIFLLNGWRIRPKEADHVLVITGNIFVDGGGQPVVNTVGSYNVSIQYTVPVQAQGYSTTSSGVDETQIVSKLNSIIELLGTKINANIIEVLGESISSIADFKSSPKDIAYEVWSTELPFGVEPISAIFPSSSLFPSLVTFPTEG